MKEDILSLTLFFEMKAREHALPTRSSCDRPSYKINYAVSRQLDRSLESESSGMALTT